MLEEKPTGITEPEFEEEIDVGLPFKVVLYNDDWHTFDEVIDQIIKAINCSLQKARDLTFEVHVKGKAIVFFGPLPECLKVSSVLEEIELHTQIISQ
ncbi:MAG: ATP-dependent Clp protease adaptor ClpS [Melioribacteraceae bacterium]|jgi:ATP-dependent Clp protease adaptor protein ClpS|nr:MAG: ATP-dependent Clp protease adaptor ClpS [Melioribacteraceae bacterium]